MSERQSSPDSEAGSGGGVPRGVLGLPGRLPFVVGRTPPPDDLGWLIDRFWTSQWQVRPGRRITARVLPHPNVNLTVQTDLRDPLHPSLTDSEVVLTGISHGVFGRSLTGTGDVLGLKFTVGSFRLLSDTAVQSLSPTGRPDAELIPGGRRLRDALRTAADRDDQRRLLIDYLRDLALAPVPELEAVQRVTEALLHDPRIGSVAAGARQEGVSERTLQRMFHIWVGVTPGWVLRRGRLHAAVERVIQLAAGRSAERPGAPDTTTAVDTLAEVAAEYGYADQAHFTNDFRRILGEPPAAWIANLVSESAA